MVVANLPEILNEEFAEGRFGVQYLDWIDVEGGVRPYSFAALKNSLPAGLKLSDTGVISGKPAVAGTYLVNVRVIDGAGAVVEKEIQLNVSGNEWIHPEYDQYGSNYTPAYGPSTEEVGYEININYHPQIMLSSEEMLILVRDNYVDLYQKIDGGYLETVTLTGRVVDAVVMKDYLVIAEVNGKLTTYEYDTQVKKTISTEINNGTQLYLYRDKVMTVGGSKLQLRDKESLALYAESILPTAVDSSVKGIVHGTEYYYQGVDNKIHGIDLINQEVILTSEIVGDITDMTMVEEELILSKENGLVIGLNIKDGSTQILFDYGKTISFLIPHPDGLIIGDSNELIILSQEDMNGKSPCQIAARMAGNFEQVIAGQNRIYVAGSGEIGAYKMSNLTRVWSYPENHGWNLLLSGNILYAVGDSKLYRFDGSINYHPPVTNLSIIPEMPDGDNGYYLKEVLLFLSAEDQDSEVAATYYSLNDSPFAIYSENIVLPEGEHRIRYYSMDDLQKMEEIKESAVIKVDTTAPEVQIYSDEPDGDNGYYRNETVNLWIEAWDETSGENIYYKADKAEEKLYTGPFTVSGIKDLNSDRFQDKSISAGTNTRD